MSGCPGDERPSQNGCTDLQHGDTDDGDDDDDDDVVLRMMITTSVMVTVM